jgi:hypothetical protein
METVALLSPAINGPMNAPASEPMKIAAVPMVEAIPAEPQAIAAVAVQPSPATLLESGPVIMVAAMPVVATPSEPEPKPITRWPSAPAQQSHVENVEERSHHPQAGEESAG